MLRSWRLGRLAGIDLFVHSTFLILPAYVFLSNLEFGIRQAGLGVAVTLAVFACVLLHELGHAFAGRVFGIGTKDITLYPIGGVARLNHMPEAPLAEIVIALAGPFVNVAIAGGLLLGVYLSSANFASSQAPFVAAFVVHLLVANVVLVVFNMLPAFPMDGGRVLRALLALVTDRVRATALAVRIGLAVPLLLAVVSLMPRFHLPLYVPIVVGMTVFVMGRRELAAEQAAARDRAVEDLPVPPTVDFSGYAYDDRRRTWVIWRDGRPVGACSSEDAIR